MLSQKQGGDSEIWREHLRAILDLDLITAPAKQKDSPDEQIPL